MFAVLHGSEELEYFFLGHDLKSLLAPLSSGAGSVLTRVAGGSLTGAGDWGPERLGEEEKEPKETLEEIEGAGEEEWVLVVEG